MRDVKKEKGGFTLIELLFVIAIIAILSSVVFGSLNASRAKAHDSAVKLTLANLRSLAEDQFYTFSPNSYSPVCFAGPVDLVLDDLGTKEGVIASNYQCTSTNNEWAAIFPLKSKIGYWCSDSQGSSKSVVGFLANTNVGSINCDNATASSTGGGSGGSSAPIVTLLGANPYDFWTPSNNPFAGNSQNKYVEPGYTATDAEDGNITANVAVTGPTLISSTQSGCKTFTYTLIYGVTDSSGTSAVSQSRTVIHHKCNQP